MHRLGCWSDDARHPAEAAEAERWSQLHQPKQSLWNPCQQPELTSGKSRREGLHWRGRHCGNPGFRQQRGAARRWVGQPAARPCRTHDPHQERHDRRHREELGQCPGCSCKERRHWVDDWRSSPAAQPPGCRSTALKQPRGDQADGSGCRRREALHPWNRSVADLWCCGRSAGKEAQRFPAHQWSPGRDPHRDQDPPSWPQSAAGQGVQWRGVQSCCRHPQEDCATTEWWEDRWWGPNHWGVGQHRRRYPCLPKWQILRRGRECQGCRPEGGRSCQPIGLWPAEGLRHRRNSPQEPPAGGNQPCFQSRWSWRRRDRCWDPTSADCRHPGGGWSADHWHQEPEDASPALWDWRSHPARPWILRKPESDRSDQQSVSQSIPQGWNPGEQRCCLHRAHRLRRDRGEARGDDRGLDWRADFSPVLVRPADECRCRASPSPVKAVRCGQQPLIQACPEEQTPGRKQPCRRVDRRDKDPWEDLRDRRRRKQQSPHRGTVNPQPAGRPHQPTRLHPDRTPVEVLVPEVPCCAESPKETQPAWATAQSVHRSCRCRRSDRCPRAKESDHRAAVPPALLEWMELAQLWDSDIDQ